MTLFSYFLHAVVYISIIYFHLHIHAFTQYFYHEQVVTQSQFFKAEYSWFELASN